MNRLRNYPVLHALQRKAGLDWAPIQILGLLMLIGGVATFGFVLWPDLLTGTRMRDEPIRSVIMGVGVPTLYFAVIGGSLWFAHRTARTGLARWIAGYGDFNTTAADIEADLEDDAVEDACVQIGRRWICHVRRETTLVLPIEQLVWVYVDRGLVLNTRRGHYVANLKPNEAEQCLEALRRREPWIAYGDSPGLVGSWHHDPADVLRLVDRARAEGVSFESLAGPALVNR